jgi:hypothetical protein
MVDGAGFAAINVVAQGLSVAPSPGLTAPAGELAPAEPVIALLRRSAAKPGYLTDGGASAGSAARALPIAARARMAARLRAEGLFDALPLVLQATLDPDPIHQVHHIEGDRIHTLTTVRLGGVDPIRVSRALAEEPWTWWHGGHVSHWHRTPLGGTAFVLWPMWLRSPIRLGIELMPPAEASPSSSGRAGRHTIFRARFFANFEGPGAFEVSEAIGGALLRSRWYGVRPRGVTSLVPVSAVLAMHLWSEHGTLSFPFPSGTGFPGLLESLGARDA